MAGASFIARTSSMLTVLISMLLVYRYLGDKRFGWWIVITSFTALAFFADFEFSLGIINNLANAHGRDSVRDILIVLFHGYLVMATISISMLLIVVLSVNAVEWH